MDICAYGEKRKRMQKLTNYLWMGKGCLGVAYRVGKYFSLILCSVHINCDDNMNLLRYVSVIADSVHAHMQIGLYLTVSFRRSVYELM